MTLSNSNTKAGPYLTNGSTTSFTFPYKVQAASDLKVYRTDIATGLDDILTSGYTVSLVNSGADGAVVTTGYALPTGYRITLVREVNYLQDDFDATAGSTYYADTVEGALDKRVMQIQQLKEQIDRALKIPVTVTGVNTDMPIPEAGKFIGWNATGTGVENKSSADLANAAVFADWNSEVFAGDGSRTSFTLAATPGSLASLDVSISGVTQLPSTAYSLSGKILTFTSAPPNGSSVLVRYGSATSNSNMAFLTQLITATAGQTIITLTDALYVPGANTVAVYLNGIRMIAGNDFYETSASSITFASPLTAGDEVMVQAGAAVSVYALVPADNSVTNSKLASAAVTADKIADLSVTTSKVADASITPAKLSPAVVSTNKMIGEVFMHAGTPVAGGGVEFMICDGRALDRVAYADLFNSLGGVSSPHGLPNGSQFNIPDAQGRSPLFSGAGTSLTARTIGQKGGAETHVLTIAEMPNHNHIMNLRGTGAEGTTTNTVDNGTTTGADTFYGGVTDTTGGGGAHNNMHPYIVFNLFIRAK